MNENEFELDGVRYVAKASAPFQGCTGCAFSIAGCTTINRPGCRVGSRDDATAVIFVRADEKPTTTTPTTSDGSTADYYQLPAGATQLQELIAFRNMNAQDGEIFRAIYRKGHCSHSDRLREAKKVLFYAQAEVARLEKYGEQA